MPRTARALVAGGHYHLINRGNNRATVFQSRGDYDAFVRLMEQAQSHIRLSLLAVCLMPNHFHLVAAQRRADDISRWMHWLLTTFGARHHGLHGSCGRLWQGRFKAFPIEQDHHLLTVMRYVERNALRSGLVPRAEDWEWSSLAWRDRARGRLLSLPPLALPRDWRDRVNAAQTAQELAALRECVNRQKPFGNDAWVQGVASDLGLEFSIRLRGRPPGRPSRPGTPSTGSARPRPGGN